MIVLENLLILIYVRIYFWYFGVFGEVGIGKKNIKICFVVFLDVGMKEVNKKDVNCLYFRYFVYRYIL